MAGQRVDFRRIAAAALASLESLLMDWLPDGKRDGHEYKALNPTRADGKPGSFSINLNSGAWADFATDDKGGDAISLYAYLQGIPQGDAARQLAAKLGIHEGAAAPTMPGRKRTEAAAAKSPPAPESDGEGGARRPEWQPLLPVPEDAPAPPKAHLKRGLPEATWTYRDREGRVLGLVYRFRTSDGGKEVLPCSYAEHAQTRAREWRWIAFPQPRPLYGLPQLDERSVLIVEGEKCADAASAALTGDERSPLAVLTWPGGSKAVDKADWSPLAGRNVLIWPDCDAQVSKSGALLPELAQPGIKAAERIATLLAELVSPAKVRIVAIPAPGTRAPGWDVADAIAEGWTRTRLIEFMRTNQREPGSLAKDTFTQLEAPASGDAPRRWQDALIWQGKGLKDCRENVIYILRDHPAWQGVLGADTFAKRIVTRAASPLGHAAGVEWTPDDDISLGLWMVAQREQLLLRSPETIRQGVQHVAKLHRFHPVREFLEGLVWDRLARIDGWPAQFLGSPDTPYTRLVGRFFLINLVRRIFEPGCIMRSVPVLEGPQDRGKSTALRILAAPWSSDTPFRVGDKDAFQQIQGVLLYEISELESFTRAEATAVKAFVSSVEDNFRAPYERQNEKHPRQTMFAATTNAAEYLKDWTGNTRFWPLPCGDAIDLDGIAASREQLLAEAVALYRQGERTYPTAQQQATLFKPEQDRRMLIHPWQEVISEALTSDIDWKYRDSVTVKDLLHEVLKVDLARLNPQGSEAQRVGQIMHALGWSKRRASNQSRAWTWARPEVPAAQSADDDEIPF